jgi:hypothetical protein
VVSIDRFISEANTGLPTLYLAGVDLPGRGENDYQCTAGQRSRLSLHSHIERTLSELARCSHKLQINSGINFLNSNCQYSGKYILVSYKTRT